MKTIVTTNEQLVKYANEIFRILLKLPDERIAQIYSIINRYGIPEELKNIEPYIELDNTEKLNSAYFLIFSDAISKIVPKETLKKIHYRDNLAPDNNWNFAFDMFYNNKESKITIDSKTFDIY